jgi:hypothetical protein
VLHLLEGILMRIQGPRLASPLFVESKRGKIVGGYHLQGFWPLPLFLLAPVADGPLHPPWEPLLSGNWQAAGWDILVFPAVVGFSQLTLAFLPKDKIRQSSGLLFGYAAVMIAGALLTWLWEPIGLLVALLSILLHEGVVRLGNEVEKKRSPLFVSDAAGLKILAVLPGSAAAQAEIRAGETVHKVNGERVRTKEEMHMAMRINPAYCKLEVLNLEGQSKFVNRPLYADEHHQLGLILAPDDRAPYYVEEKKPDTIASYLRKKWLGLVRNGRNTGSGL